jgi:ATP-dependent DNA helicase DinG
MKESLGETLRARLPDYEPRTGQERMAEAVERVLREGGSLLVEAGTGTGKSLAYLVPLAAHLASRGGRAVVSTYTKALQRQLVQKELPFLAEHVFPGLRFALCVGSENYLCLRRLEQARMHGLFENAPPEALERLLAWAAETDTGRREGTGGQLWQTVSRQSDLCWGSHCRHRRACFYFKGREEQARSRILVLNHHLYFANLASGMRALPEFEAAVFDEAHELEDVASSYLSTEVTNFRVLHVLNGVLGPEGKGLLARLKWLAPREFTRLGRLAEQARRASADLFSELGGRLPAQPVRLRKTRFVPDTLSEPLLTLAQARGGLGGKAGDDEDGRRELEAAALRLTGTARALRAVLEQELAGHVYWAERSRQVLRLAATPVDVAGMNVFEDLGSAVFTSATMTSGGSFAFVRERLGLLRAEELLVPSHFKYREQALIYIARDLPPPGSEGYEEGALGRIEDILLRAEGGTLVLFTSHGMLRRAARALSEKGIPVLTQGDADSYALVEEFKRLGRAVLLGTYTFWQGVDVPGEALSTVVITKLPFAVPDEPVAEARMEALRGRGQDPFMHYQVPRAAIMLKQGFGRLIRRSSDRGTVAILDSRILSRAYGKEFLRSLPRCSTTVELAAVEEWAVRWKGENNGQKGTDQAGAGFSARPRHTDRQQFQGLRAVEDEKDRGRGRLGPEDGPEGHSHTP